ncbi:MAG TPA: hypothetical protein VEA18_02310 [Candidatus Kapabacteria bacterium]|nr:hypothetical protein [Candidatus Kapabacteria bacterium]
MVSTFFTHLFYTVSFQIASLFGIFFVLGFLLSILTQWTNALYRRSIGWKGILWTAWIGTPIHEMGHVLFAKLFRHRIGHVSLFQPNEATGGLGHVGHSYDTRSLYQRIGNFFIGAAPLLFGSLVLYLLLSFLVPNGSIAFSALRTYAVTGDGFFPALHTFFLTLFSSENIRAWEFWVFLYVSFSIAVHSVPSAQDRKGMWHGFLFLIFLLIIVNSVMLLFKVNTTYYVMQIRAYLTIFTAIMLYTLLLSCIHAVLAYLLLRPFIRK